jgi:hypothetical protein
MSDLKVYLKEGFFKFLVSIEELKEKKDLHIFVNSVGITHDDLKEFKEYLRRFDIVVECDDTNIYPLKERPTIRLDLNVSEWMAMQSIFSHKLVKNKIEEIQRIHAAFNLNRAQNQNFPTLNCDFKTTNNLKILETAIIKKEVCSLFFINNHQCEVIPLRITYLDGIMCLIAESKSDRSLSYFAISDLSKIEKNAGESDTHISQIEVNEFIGHLRIINGNEERLILKLYNPGEVDLLPKYHHLHNPFVTSNSEGDMIWAASVEMCENVYEWLYSMKDFVEVLDPGHIRKEFAQYCMQKDDKKISEKAS